MNPSPCAGACPPDLHCIPCLWARRRSRGRFIGTPEVPVRRYGEVPRPPDGMLYLEEVDEGGAAPRTIGERGARAVWAAALLAGLVAGALLYA